jgi:serine/threonine-protein kinase/endoribonuclease IRE1
VLGVTTGWKTVLIKDFFLSGHHETPLSASTKMLERFPNNLPKHRENVIPADLEKKNFEEVSGEEN